jgi:two-component system, NarL family, nitrate/nitrite response regulator NarL
VKKSLVGVLIVDDFPAWRNFVALQVKQKKAWRIVSEASEGVEAIQKACEFRPEVVVLDIGLPGVTGLEVAQCILRDLPATKILFLSENRSCEVVQESIRIGACGYVLKSDSAKDFLPAMAAVLRGEIFLSTNLGILMYRKATAKSSPSVRRHLQ